MNPTNKNSLLNIPWYRNPKVRAVIYQLVLVVVTLVFLSIIVNNTVTNLANRSIKTTFSFLTDVATFSIPLNFLPFWEFTLGESIYWDVFIIGVQNTSFIALLGIPSAMVVGIVIGLMGLSPNYLLRKISVSYVEVLRNTPLLLQLLFWHFALFPPIYNSLPPVNESIKVAGTVFNSSGLYFPWPTFNTTSGIGLAVCFVLIIAIYIFMAKWARARKDQTGKDFPVITTCFFITISVLLVYVLVMFNHIGIDLPVKKGLNFTGGARPPKELITLWFGLTVYTSSYIAENVRGGILSVSYGQNEAAMALGISRTLRMKLVIMPQALRVIIPPTISQFLNLTKNSSLAVAVGYPEITNIWLGITLNQTGQALIIIFMTITVYECINLLTSYITNVYNKSVQITEK